MAINGKYANVDIRNQEMKADYATSRMTYTDLAEKYGVSYSQVQRIARENDFRKARKEATAQIKETTVDKVVRGITQRVTSINAKHFKTWEKVLVIVNNMLDDPDRYLRRGDGMYVLGRIEVIAKVMLMVQQGQRESKGIGDPIELKKLDIAMKRLELEAKKIAGEPEELPDDGFMDAIKADAEKLWEDEADGTSEASEE